MVYIPTTVTFFVLSTLLVTNARPIAFNDAPEIRRNSSPQLRELEVRQQQGGQRPAQPQAQPGGQGQATPVPPPQNPNPNQAQNQTPANRQRPQPPQGRSLSGLIDAEQRRQIKPGQPEPIGKQGNAQTATPPPPPDVADDGATPNGQHPRSFGWLLARQRQGGNGQNGQNGQNGAQQGPPPPLAAPTATPLPIAAPPNNNNPAQNSNGNVPAPNTNNAGGRSGNRQQRRLAEQGDLDVFPHRSNGGANVNQVSPPPPKQAQPVPTPSSPPPPAVPQAHIAGFRPRTRGLSPPTIPGHWIFKNQKLLGAPWRAVLLAEKYKPQYGDIVQLSTPFKTVIVLNSLQAVSEVLEKQSAITSDRPRNVMLFEMCEYGHAVAFRNHDELQRKYRRVMASSLHPAAARSYAELHTATSAFFLRDIVDRLQSLSNENHLVIEPNHSVPMAASIQDAIGRFIMRMTYGHVVVENDPLLAMVKRQTEFIFTGFARHYWVNNFPILRYVPKWLPGAEFARDAEYRRKQRAIVARDFAVMLKRVSQGTVERPSYSSRSLEQKGGANTGEEDINLVKWTAQSMFAG